MLLYSLFYFFDNFSLKPMTWVPCGISLQKEMPPYSHVQHLNNCKHLIWNLLALSKILQNSPRGEGFTHWPTD